MCGSTGRGKNIRIDISMVQTVLTEGLHQLSQEKKHREKEREIKRQKQQT